MTAETAVRTPWEAYSEGVPMHLTYPDCAMVDMVAQSARKTPDLCAYTF